MAHIRINGIDQSTGLTKTITTRKQFVRVDRVIGTDGTERCFAVVHLRFSQQEALTITSLEASRIESRLLGVDYHNENSKDEVLFINGWSEFHGTIEGWFKARDVLVDKRVPLELRFISKSVMGFGRILSRLCMDRKYGIIRRKGRNNTYEFKFVSLNNEEH